MRCKWHGHICLEHGSEDCWVIYIFMVHFSFTEFCMNPANSSNLIWMKTCFSFVPINPFKVVVFTSLWWFNLYFWETNSQMCKREYHWTEATCGIGKIRKTSPVVFKDLWIYYGSTCQHFKAQGFLGLSA